MTTRLLSRGTLLGGRVVYVQPAEGYRTGIEPVLLAACVPAQPGERVVEAGIGAGAALLALAARVPGLNGVGIERDPKMAQFARANIAANGHDKLHILVQDVLGWQPDLRYDHAMANPPWHSDAGTQSPDQGRRSAKQAGDRLLTDWVAAMARALLRRGTLTLALPASQLARGVCALTQAGCGEIAVQPLWPRAGHPARLIILQGVKEGRGASRLLPGLVLHAAEGGYTDEAEAVLRHGKALGS